MRTLLVSIANNLPGPSWASVAGMAGRGCRLATSSRWAARLLCTLGLLAAALGAPACLAADSHLIEKAFVLDPSNLLTLEQAQARTLTPYAGHFDNGFDISTAWIRLRVRPASLTGEGTAALSPAHPSIDKLRLVPMWSRGLTVYDPMQRDTDGRILPIELRPSTDASQVYVVDVPRSEAPRDLWIRFTPNGPSLLAAELLSAQEATARQVWDATVESVAIGMLSLMLVIGAAAWWVDSRGVGRALFFKQLLNLALALESATLFASAGLAGAVGGPVGTQGLTAQEVGLLRVLNQVASLWFFIKVLEIFQATAWALRTLQVLLVVVAANWLLLLFGQDAMFRLAGASLHLVALLIILACGSACQVETEATSARLRPWVQGLQKLGLGLLMALAWIGSFVSGYFKTEAPSAMALIVPVPIVGAIGVLLLLGLRRIRLDNLRRQHEQRNAELREQALLLERGERQRQQEFMVMLTHELKAPLSTLGMVLGNATPSDSMRRHAGLALVSMRQVIDHCAQSVEFEGNDAPMRREACSLWVELELRHAALADRERERVRLDPDPGLPALQADRRMLTVIVNNLLENSLRYSAAGSAVRVSVWREPGRQATSQAAMQCLRVSNATGDAPLPDASRLFQKYYRGEATHRNSGSGLGLYLARLLARRMGGDLVYEGGRSEVSFTVRLPE